MRKRILLAGIQLLLLLNTSIEYSWAQQKRITGKVTTVSGEELPGVSILVKGTKSGTLTASDGTYSLPFPTESATLVFSYVGFISKEEQIGNRDVVNVVLNTDEAALSEVVVVGYGSKSKTNITGAVSNIKLEEVIGSRPSTDIGQLLQGASPGLQVTYDAGEPGTSTNLNIRGTTSINGGAPLIVLDNVPIASLDLINPSDIETVTVLKDAGSAAIYGSRSAWGVIVLTTQKGNKDSKPKFSYSNNIVFNKANDLPQKASPTDLVKAYGDIGFSSYWSGQDVKTWSDLLADYATNPAKYPTGSYNDVENNISYPLKTTDSWKDLTDSYGFQQNHNFAVHGGTSKLSYRVSTGFTKEDGILTTNKDSYKRSNISTFLSSDITSWFTSQLSVLYNNSTKSFPYSNIADYGIFSLAAVQPSYAELGYSTIDGQQIPNYTPRNAVIQSDTKNTNLENIRLSGRGILRPFSGFTVTGEYTFDKINSVLNQYDKPWNYSSGDGTTEPSSAHSDYLKNNSFLRYKAINIYAEYRKTLGNHNIGVLGGYNEEESDFQGLQSRRLDGINVNIPSIALGTGTLTSQDTSSQYSLRGYFYRVNYDYKGKYLVEITGRYDGSSKFPSGNRWGFFPSFSAGWRVSEESFFEPVTFISDLKIRASYGHVGNQSINPYQFTPSLSAIYSNWINSDGLLLTLSSPSAVSSQFSWEKVTTKNLGIDFGLLKNRLTGTFDIYERATKGMLAAGTQIPAVLGTDAPLQNVADLVSKGWEFQLGWRDRIGQVNYNFGFNLYDSQAKIKKYNNTTNLLSDYYVGKNLGEIWGYETDGLYKTSDFEATTLDANYTGGTLLSGVVRYEGQSPNVGDVKFKDLNGDGVINDGDATVSNPGDKKVIGNSTPRYQFGIRAGAEWKGFDVSIFVQGIGKQDRWIANDLTFPYYHAPWTTIYESGLDFWRPGSPDANYHYGRVYPQQATNGRQNQTVQSKYLSNASYWRIKNITFGYSVPKKLLAKARIENVRLFASFENLFTKKHLPPGVEPTFISKGVPNGIETADYGGQYPLMKKFSFGLNLSF